MQEIILEFISAYGYIAIMLLILIENIFPPIPSEVVLLFGGYMVTLTDMSPVFVILYATLGAILGAMFLYALGCKLKKDRLKRLFGGKLGKILHLKPSLIEKSYYFFEKYNKSAVFICRCIPVARSLISIPAGITKMKISYFLVYSLVGTIIWNSLLVSIGFLLGDMWQKSLIYLNRYSLIIFVFIALVILYSFFKNKFKKE